MIGESTQESARQVQRYIRLTYLIPELLQLVDDGKIALTPAVELSYLPEKAQAYLLEEMRRNDCTPSLSQAIRMKKLYQTSNLSPEDISTIMSARIFRTSIYILLSSLIIPEERWKVQGAKNLFMGFVVNRP